MQKSMTKTDYLLQFMAEACYFAQEHISDPQAWGDPMAAPSIKNNRANALQCTSMQMACFLALNTKYGNGGVEWDVLLDELTDPKLNKQGMMQKSIAQWKKIILKVVKSLGGWKEEKKAKPSKCISPYGNT